MGSLVAQQTTATALTADLATLINWVNVEAYSSFRVIVENTGGGSAHDIYDVTIDESSDGGTTISLDQHAATPAVPIVAGASAHKAFTSTAKYVRVRAKCDTAKDTTGKAWLLADTITGLLCTLNDVRNRCGLSTTDTSQDDIINDIIRGVSSIFDIECNRTLLLNTSDETEYYNGGNDTLILRRYPVKSFTSITESSDYDWDNETALTANDDYRAAVKSGVLKRLYSIWSDGTETVRVVYKGGYVGAGQTPGTGETALPNDLREAAILQSQFLFKRKDDVGLSSVSSQGFNITKYESMELLPIVRRILAKYKRYA